MQTWSASKVFTGSYRWWTPLNGSQSQPAASGSRNTHMDTQLWPHTARIKSQNKSMAGLGKTITGSVSGVLCVSLQCSASSSSTAISAGGLVLCWKREMLLLLIMNISVLLCDDIISNSQIVYSLWTDISARFIGQHIISKIRPPPHQV